MARRILLADEAQDATAIARGLGERGYEVDGSPPCEIAARVTPGSHVAALVRGGDTAAVAALRAADPLLPVIAAFPDRSEADRQPEAAEVDGVLVGPLGALAVAGACALAERLRAASARATELEARLAWAASPGARDLEFLKRLLFVEVKRSRRYGYPLALAVLAVDGWDQLAPSLEPGARLALLGDVLGEVSRAVRDVDLALPFSEERLVVLMPHTKADGAMRVARRVCARIRARDRAPAVTASVGVAAHSGDGTISFGGLVKRAGDALARARASGGDRVEAAAPPRRRDRISIG